MPNYEEIIKQSQANVKSLSEKLNDLDKLHQDIKELIKQPEMFDAKYQQIVKLTEDYTNTLGASTKKYLEGNNTLFTTKLSELSTKIKEFETEISRLLNTDFTKLFNELQKVFIDQTKEDLEKELKRFEDKSKDLQNKINELSKEVERLKSIDLIVHFDKLQKTLAEIFGAINAINITLTNIIQTLTVVVQSLGTIQNSIDTYHKTTSKQLDELAIEAKKNAELIVSKMKYLADQNEILRKEIKTNKLIQFIGIGLTLIILIYLIYKL
jgi:DNA repair exonuclease SbcCD ATPase subunit